MPNSKKTFTTRNTQKFAVLHLHARAICPLIQMWNYNLVTSYKYCVDNKSDLKP